MLSKNTNDIVSRRKFLYSQYYNPYHLCFLINFFPKKGNMDPTFANIDLFNETIVNVDNINASNLFLTNLTVSNNITAKALTANSLVSVSAAKVLTSIVMTDGSLLIGDTGGPPISANITGTADQVNVVNGAGSITLGLPQSIATTSDVTFNEINATVANLTNVYSSSVISTEVLANTIETQNFTLSDTTLTANASQTPAEIFTSYSNNTVNGNINFPLLTASKPLKTDASKIVSSGDIILTSEVSGVLPVVNGGTAISSLTGNRVVLSTSSALVEAPAMTNGQLIIGKTGLAPGTATLTGTTNQVNVTNGSGSITLGLPQSIATTSNVTFSVVNAPTVTATDVATTNVTADNITTSVIQTGTISLVGHNNNRIVVTSGGNITEAAALTNGQLLIGSTGLAPVAATLTGTTNQVNVTNSAGGITLSLPQDISDLSSPSFANITTSSIVASTLTIPSIFVTSATASKPARYNASKQLISGTIDLNSTNDVTGIVPITSGGTATNTPLNNSRMMISSGGKITEAGALTNGQIFIGSTGVLPVAASITSTDLTVTGGAGTIALSLPTSTTHNTTWTGIWGSNPTGNITYNIMGKWAMLALPQVSAAQTTSAAITNVTALPTALRPVNTFYFYMNIRDNATEKLVRAQISNAGVITIWNSDAFTSWTGAGTGLFYNAYVSYLVG